MARLTSQVDDEKPILLAAKGPSHAALPPPPRMQHASFAPHRTRPRVQCVARLGFLQQGRLLPLLGGDGCLAPPSQARTRT
jgi:hypothetical protein